MHLGTGNYNDSTAKLYTDCGMFTCSEKIGQDATAVFNMLSGYSEPSTWNKLVVAPLWMRNRFLHLIQMETENAKKGQKGHIIAKMNSLCDRDIIAALYAASQAGVKIELIVRGICCTENGNSRYQRKYFCPFDCRRFSGTCENILFLQQWTGRNLYGKRRLDAAKSG